VTERDDKQLHESDPTPSRPDAVDPAVDHALRGLADLDSAPLAEHHDRLAKVHEVLQEALDRTDDSRERAP
jgi:hypothetical protein